MATTSEIDYKKWEAAVGLVRAGGYFRRLMKEGAPLEEVKEAEAEYRKALRKFKRMQKV